MKRISRVILIAAAIAALILAAGCRTNRKTVPPPVTQPTTVAAPEVAPPPAPESTPVAEPTDFVQETPQPVEEVFPADIEELNRYVQERGYIRDAFFGYDEATLNADAQDALASSARWLRSNEGSAYNLLVEGHTDERGTEQYNLALGDRRANIVKDYLVTLGVDRGRIRTVSYGEERPFATGHDEAAWSQNRRAHLVLVR